MAERADVPLFVWTEARRRDREQRERRRRRLALGALGGLGIAALIAPLAAPPAPRLVWNHSASAPRGLYLVSPGARLERGDMVVARLPEAWRALAAVRRYLPAKVPLVKQVAALEGEGVCAHGAILQIDSGLQINSGRTVRRLARDARGRALPWWEGCLRLRRDEAFLLMADNPASFDARYFGVTQGRDIVGKARLVWAR